MYLPILTEPEYCEIWLSGVQVQFIIVVVNVKVYYCIARDWLFIQFLFTVSDAVKCHTLL